MSETWSMWWRRNGVNLALLGWVPLVLIVSICILAYRDAQEAQDSILRAEMAQVRTTAVRNVTQLEMTIVDIVAAKGWSNIQNTPEVQRIWREQNKESHALFVAIVAPSGQILLHTNPAVTGQSIGSEWYDYVVHTSGSGVVKLKPSTLSEDHAAYDLRVPITHNHKIVADYHIGLDAEAVDKRIALVRRNAMKGWIVPLLLATLLTIATYLALMRWALAMERCHQQVMRAEQEHARVLGQIAGGLAHEIRNPLHALRMNLHVLGGVLNGKSPLTPEDLAATFSSSLTEINRIDQLIRELLRYAIPDGDTPEVVNLTSELQATLTLMQQDLKQRNIEMRAEESETPAMVSIAPSQLRQALVNLLTFAQDNAGPQGRVDVALKRTGSYCELDITDSGPTLSESRMPHIFEPFQATQETGSGFSLALVKSYVERAGGSVVCVENPPRGNRMLIRFPQLKASL